MENLTIFSLKADIERAFKSLVKSGRPDIRDDQNKDLIPFLYEDLYNDNYILRQVLDDNHAILKGRKGTGKSTVFLQAENEIAKNKNQISIYINLWSCYEEIKTADAESNANLTKYRTYYNFFDAVISSMKKSIDKRIIKDHEIDKLFNSIKKGDFIDTDFQRSLSISITHSSDKGTSFSTGYNEGLMFTLDTANQNAIETVTKQEINELRIFSISSILNELKRILNKHSINRVYLFLDDFSELNRDHQRLIVDSLISPIISSYNEVFTVKLAAYPHRLYLGNIDNTKIIVHSLDFYDVYEQSSKNYQQVEDRIIDYVKRTLLKRLDVYTHNQITLEDIFDVSSKTTLQTYLRTLFYASAGIPRSLGYVLSYCYLSSINEDKPITIANINSAARKYYNDNILPDFYSDTRFKQSFYDDEKILDQIAQKNLQDQLIEKAKRIKREIISSYQKKECKQIYIETIENYRTANYWIPTSHFYVDKDMEYILQTLELYFIVSKFNEGSTRDPGKRISTFGLNYGLCLENAIDYGRPEFRRTYDYWRQDEFDLTRFIPDVLRNMEIPTCKSCGYQYTDENEIKMAKKFGHCLQCGKDDIVNVNKLRGIYERNMQFWVQNSLPDTHINILRLLYNYKDTTMTAFEIGSELDRHHLAITIAMNKLLEYGYVSYTKDGIRHYKIEDKATDIFFNESKTVTASTAF